MLWKEKAAQRWKNGNSSNSKEKAGLIKIDVDAGSIRPLTLFGDLKLSRSNSFRDVS
jgi:hypothetical protein